MSLLNKGPSTPTNDKRPSLNPNAAEFVPFALRSPSSTTTAAANADQWSRFATAGTTTVGKSVLDRTESSVSNNSDDEAHQYWRHQLPDDITPDFKVTGEEDSHGINSLPFSSFSLAEVEESSRFFSPSSATSFMLKEQQQVQQRDSSPSGINGGYSVSPYGEDHSPVSYNDLHAKPWDHHQIMDNENLVHGVLGDVLNEPTDLNPIDFLASQFPGYSAESLADIYLGSGGDLNLTVETLTQLELQVEGGGLSPNMNPETLSAPNLNALNFPALSVSDCQNGMPKFSGDDHQHVTSPYHRSTAEKENLLMFKTSNSFPSRSGSVDFASAVRKLASQDYGMWKYDRNGSSADVSVGSSRSSHVLASSYNGGQSRSVYGTDRLQSRGSSRSAAPVWLETGEAVGNMYTEMREEARDHARLRNVYFEQARQAYIIGNKALAKELSIKGQLHNIQMKAAHGKAQESIYRQRNPVSSQMMSQQHERVIDLHGLHVSEAIHVLKKDLAVLRSACARSATNLQVYICVGTGHHTRGSRTPARLPTAVQRYLLEEEGLDFTEPQPGLLRVIIC